MHVHMISLNSNEQTNQCVLFLLRTTSAVIIMVIVVFLNTITAKHNLGDQTVKQYINMSIKYKHKVTSCVVKESLNATRRCLNVCAILTVNKFNVHIPLDGLS